MSVILRTILTMLVLSRTPALAANNPVSQSPSQQKQTQDQINPTLFKHSLSGLYKIESFKTHAIQPYNEFDALYSHAAIAQQELETICMSTSLLSQSQAVFAGIKSEQRAKEKIDTDLSGEVNKITDLARATIIADDVAGLVTAYENINKQTKVVAVKNRFKSPAASGYRDLNILVELPESKIIAEVQLHLSEIEKVKSGPEHDLYEVIQKIERTAQAEKRDINQFESTQIAQLRRQSVELYQQAWQPYITTHLVAA
ncbi:phosphoribosylglycinamide formyltransferase [Vibrio sp. 99-8-1]|uniref:phosphoribosylglycinamide formyltransferase n=1 Tax=Vibrio sp. 99-8-1 TaxID=2607602 RepID=UPI0014937C0A|nr:phosphoribosylglycinamide formyltransferase [Vibrio sp. 99-8-1]NOI68544.1 phosphoribosylglycinamide formyltransferase [Vibrio sp. 99-8-1]